jgi:NADPH:quinone reductase-like Zn-dependent oxidoreductase
MITLPQSHDLALVADLTVKGKLQVVIDKIYPFERAAEAFDYVGEGHVTGRVLVEVIPGALKDVKCIHP